MVRNDRRDVWWATPKRCSDMGPSVRVITRTAKIDAPRIMRTGVPGGSQHPRKKSLATADLVREMPLIESCVSQKFLWIGTGTSDFLFECHKRSYYSRHR